MADGAPLFITTINSYTVDLQENGRIDYGNDIFNAVAGMRLDDQNAFFKANAGPSLGTIDFDPLTQFFVGSAVMNIGKALPLAYTRGSLALYSTYWNMGAAVNATNLILAQPASTLVYNMAIRARPLLLAPRFGTMAWKVGSKTYTNMIWYSIKGRVDVIKAGQSMYNTYKNVDKVLH